ncbi:MAG: hypothetical protein FWE13_02305 [Firmicutes bacterium]|nr:hypothetical protein [Bacillota bacterium]
MKNIRRKIITIIIGVILVFASFTSLTACSFFEENQERVNRQVVAVVMPGTEYEENIYHWQLIQRLNQILQGQQMTQLPTESQMIVIIEDMVDQRLIAIERNRMFARGDLIFRGDHRDAEGNLTGRLYHPITGEPICAFTGTDTECPVCHGDPDRVYGCNIDFTDINQVREVLFNSINAELATIRNNILSSHGEELPIENTPGELPQPEFPVRTPEVPDHYVPQTELFIPDRAYWPGATGGAEQRSLQTQALRRLVSSFEQAVIDFPREHDEARLQSDRDMINEKFANRDYIGLYLALVDTYMIEFIGGEDIKNQVRDSILQRYLADAVEVSREDVYERFTFEQNTQRVQWTNNHQAFASAVSGNQRILFRPNNDFFYVKHILLPFTDAQTARLSNFRQRPNITRADIEQFRSQLVDEIRVHPRREDGFPDLRNPPLTAQEVLNIVRAEVNPLSANPRYADRRFTDFIYMFNTDPGAFTHHLGYAMPHNREAGGQFMPEFEQGGWTLAEEYQVGQVLTNFIVTDFGVHIMFYASNPPAGYMAHLSSFQTIAEENTWFDVFYNEIRGQRQAREFQVWANNVILEARIRGATEVQEIFPRAFRDLVE